MPPRPPIRTLIGTSGGLAERQRVYETPEAIESDETEGHTGTRRRVLYDEVLLVTLHRSRGWGFAAAMAVVATVIAGVAAVVAAAGRTAAGVNVLLLAAVPLGLLVLRLAVEVETVTVYGRRSRARVSFWLRGSSAREAFERICARVRHVQERAAREAAAAAGEARPPSEAAS